MSSSADKTHQYLKAKIQIGNVQGPITYNLGQTVFHHDDIPEPKRARRNEVKAWTKPRTLAIDRGSWNKSTDLNRPVIERRQMENYARDRSYPYQYNFRAETVDSLRQIEPVDKPTKFHISAQLESRALEILEAKDSDRVQKGNFNRTGEMPVHPNLDGKDNWNVSTYCERTEKDRRLDDITENAQEFTSVRNKKLFSAKKYVSPMQSTINLTKRVRDMKERGVFNADEAMNRKGMDPVDRKSYVNQLAIEKPNIVSTSVHSGIWERSRIDGRYCSILFYFVSFSFACKINICFFSSNKCRYMWSDTASEVYQSAGDQRHTRNMDALNVQGPNFSNSRLVQNQSRASTARSTVSDVPFILG